MKIIASAGREDVALVYIAETESGKLVECVESLQPPLAREVKWVLLVSTMFGCPVGCPMCDAGGYSEGLPSAEEIFAQIDHLVYRRFPDGTIPSRQFKVQFARMGEPSFNPAVLTVLEELPKRYRSPGLMPSLSTVAPAGKEGFFERLLEIKRELYGGGHFQFQFSIHTTDPIMRDRLIPTKKWDFQQMADYGDRLFQPGDRRITLNFALTNDPLKENRAVPVDARFLLSYFSPDKFLIKITPLNPTYRAQENRLSSHIDPCRAERTYAVVTALRDAGYRVIVSIGEVEENSIGSNCGQFLRRHLSSSEPIPDGYTYKVQPGRKD